MNYYSNYYYFDGYYLYYFLAIALFVLSLIVQAWLKAVVKKQSQVESGCGRTANDLCQRMLSEHGVTGLVIKPKSGSLTDCYSPKEGVIYLSETTCNQSSVAALAIAAHECGHACQDHDNMLIYKIRQLLAPIAGFCAQGGVWLSMIGIIIMYAFGRQNTELATFVFNLGIFVYLGAFLFYLVMFPVEVNASQRGLKFLKESGWLEGSQISGARQVLTAAGSTYFIALANAGITLMRLVMLRNSSRNRR